MRFAIWSLAMAAPLAAQPEFVYERAPFPSCHASTVVELRDGNLMAAWFGGTDEGKPDVAVWAARRTARGWSEPFELAREPRIAAYNPVLFYSKDNRLWFWFKFGPSPETWSAARAFSTDDGATWSAREYLPAGVYGPIRAKPLVMDDGTIVSGTSVESYGTWACWIERSTDNGRTFAKIGPIASPSAERSSGGRSRGIIQPSIVSLGGKRLRLYARATSDVGKVVVADSADAGLTWSPARTIDVPNPNSGIDAVSLRDGRVVLIFNNTTRGRTPLNLAVSRDGENFKIFCDLETEPGEYSYPSLIEGRSGDLHATWTWKRQRIRYQRIPLAEIPK